MFKFFTVFLLITTLLLFKVRPESMLSDLKNMYSKLQDGTETEKTLYFMKILKVLLLCLLCLTNVFIEFIYLLNAVSVDTYRYPTYVMLFLLVAPWIKSFVFKKNKTKISEDMSVEVKNALLNQTLEQTASKLNTPYRKIRKYIVRTLSVSYYIYMIYIVFFI